MYTETEPIKGSSSSSSSSAFQSAPPQNGYNFNYPPPTPTMGIPVPMNAPSHHQFPTPWSTGLCDCLDDPGTCCLTFWCPCVTFARIAAITDKGSISCGLSGTLYATILLLTGMSFCYSCFYRSKLRGQFFLEESPCSDCCVHLCCEECALCQEYRELKNRGFDMSIGWNGNVERQNLGTPPPLPPMVQEPMHR